MILFNKTSSSLFLKQTQKNRKRRFEWSKMEIFMADYTRFSSKKGFLLLPKATFGPLRAMLWGAQKRSLTDQELCFDTRRKKTKNQDNLQLIGFQAINKYAEKLRFLAQNLTTNEEQAKKKPIFRKLFYKWKTKQHIKKIASTSRRGEFLNVSAVFSM